MVTKLFHADGRTDITKLTVAFRNFANVPKNNSGVVICLNFVYVERKYEQKYEHVKTTYLLTYLLHAAGSSLII